MEKRRRVDSKIVCADRVFYQDRMFAPYDITVGISGVIYVSDNVSCFIHCFDPNGTPLRSWGSLGSRDRKFIGRTPLASGVRNGINAAMVACMAAVPILAAFPPGLLPLCSTYLGNDQVYAIQGSQVQVFDSKGTLICCWGEGGRGSERLWYPHSCAVGKDGTVYVCDTGHGLVKLFSENGTFIRNWGGNSGSEGILFNHPSSISVADDDLVFITDSDPGRMSSQYRVHCFSRDGTFVRHWSAYTQGSYGPVYGILVDRIEKTVYVVSDSGTKAVTAYQMDGTPLGSTGPIGGALYMCMDDDGSVYISEPRNHRIALVDIDVLRSRLSML